MEVRPAAPNGFARPARRTACRLGAAGLHYVEVLGGRVEVVADFGDRRVVSAEVRLTADGRADPGEQIAGPTRSGPRHRVSAESGLAHAL